MAWLVFIFYLTVSNSLNQKAFIDEIPTFSINDNWDSIEIENEFKKAMEIGFCFFEIPNEDISLYEKFKPSISSFFESTKKWPISKEGNKATLAINKEIDLEHWQKENINYGFIDRISSSIPIQTKWFAIPFMEQNGIDFMKYKSNPFKENINLINFGNNMIKHCQFVLNKIFKYLSLDESDRTMLIGNNPSKHMLLNYYDPFRANNEITKYGLMQHKDFGFITLLITDSDGLQIKHNENWFDIPYYNNKYIVIFGKIFEYTTNGKVKSALHRVKKIEDRVRTSISIYYDPDKDGNVYKYNETTKIFKFFKTMKQHYKDSFDELYVDHSPQHQEL